MFDPMNRRLFLKRAGQAVAAAAVGRAAFAGAQTSADATCDKDICKAIKFHHVAGDMSVADKFKLLKDVGFDGTEYRRRDDIDTKTLIRASEKPICPSTGSSTPPTPSWPGPSTSPANSAPPACFTSPAG